MVIALFGNNLFHLSLMDIDSILRKVHKELLICCSDEEKQRREQDQKCGKPAPKTVTDDDLASLCRKPEISPKSIEKRAELQKELLSKQRLISFDDLIDHVGRVKFGHLDTQKDEAALQLRGIIESIFQKANYKDDVPAAAAGDEPKNISKVREYIQDFSKKQ